MTTFTLKTAGLLILTLLSTLAFVSTQAFAKSPWAEETPTNETYAEEPQTEPQTEQTAEPVTTQIVEPEPESIDSEMPVEQVAVEAEPYAPEPVVNTNTSTQGTVLNTSNNSPQSVNVRVLDFPRRGMTSDKVQNELGQPQEIISSVGQPPISRWVYDDRTVYFEYSSVIHVVAK